MFAGITAALKDPIAACVGAQFVQESGWDVDAATFSGFLLFDGHTRSEAQSHHREHVTDAKTGSEADAECQPILGHKCREYVF